MKAIAIDIDDTLNNFSKILQTTAFFHNPSYPVSSERAGYRAEARPLSTYTRHWPHFYERLHQTGRSRTVDVNGVANSSFPGVPPLTILRVVA